MNTRCAESNRFDERKADAQNDVALGSVIDRLSLDRTSSPTLIIHGDADNDAPPRDAEYAHEAIAGAQLLWIDKASHIGFWVVETPTGSRNTRLTGCGRSGGKYREKTSVPQAYVRPCP